MFSLIRKDLLLQKSMIIYMFIYIIFFSLIFNNLTSDSIYLMAILISVYSSFLTAFTYDEKYKADFMFNSLPLKRKDIIIAKYISLIIYLILYSLILGILGGVISFLKLPLNIGYLSIRVIVHSSLMILFINSITLPFLFKFGQKKGRAIVSVIFFACFGALFQMYNDMITGELMINYSSNLYSMLIIGCLVLFFISAIISINIYKNKEFQ